jgi:hypothetical protein
VTRSIWRALPEKPREIGLGEKNQKFAKNKRNKNPNTPLKRRHFTEWPRITTKNFSDNRVNYKAIRCLYQLSIPRRPRPLRQCHCCRLPVDRGTQRVKRHNMIHSGEKPFECDICQKKFRDLSNLKCHILCSHSNTRRFTCVIEEKCRGKSKKNLKNLLIYWPISGNIWTTDILVACATRLTPLMEMSLDTKNKYIMFCQYKFNKNTFNYTKLLYLCICDWIKF